MIEGQVSMDAWLRSLQRTSANVLALCVMVHLVVMIYAVNGGLSAAEIMDRTQGNWAFLAFYLVFALACAVHAPIGLLNIVKDWFGWSGTKTYYAALAIGIAMGLTGVRTALVVFV
jgi:fumarate reductase subunit C